MVFCILTQLFFGRLHFVHESMKIFFRELFFRADANAARFRRSETSDRWFNCIIAAWFWSNERRYGTGRKFLESLPFLVFTVVSGVYFIERVFRTGTLGSLFRLKKTVLQFFQV